MLIPRSKMNGMYIGERTQLSYRIKGCLWGVVNVSCYLAAR